MLKLEKRGNTEWEFVHPDGYGDTLDQLGMGCDLSGNGDYYEAEKVFKDIINEMPDHLDAIHHLALVCEKTGRSKEAGVLWEKAVAMGRKAFPAEFEVDKDLLLWGFLDNRPFLRCLHGLGCAYRDTGRIEEANGIFVEILKLNPGDNQGARALAINTYLFLDKPYEALEICESYPEDCMSDTLYGRVLANYQIGNITKAGESLKQAIEILPKVAKAIVKKTMNEPKNMNQGYITVGGDDEAYEYRLKNRYLWKKTKGAIEWLEANIKKVNGRSKKRKPAISEKVLENYKINRKDRKELKRLTLIAYRREVKIALEDLYVKFADWKTNKIDEFEMNGLIHEFHDGISRELWSRYIGNPGNQEFLVARALVLDLLTDEDIETDLKEKLSTQIEMYREMSERE